MNRILKKLLSAALMGGLLFALTGCSLPRFNYGSTGSSLYFAGDASVGGKVENLDVNWASGSVTVVTGDVDSVEIEEVCSKELSDEERVHWRVEGDTLYVQFAKPGLSVTTGVGEKKLTITIPQSIKLKEVEIDAASADITCEGTAAEKFELDTASGNITLSAKAEEIHAETASGTITVSAEASEFQLESSSGAILLEQSGTAKKIGIDSASGKIRASVDAVSEMEIDSASGEVELTVPDTLGFTLELDIASGNFESEIALTVNGERYIAGNGKAKFSIDTSSGNVKLRKK